MEKFKNRKEQREITETMDSVLLPLLEYLNDETAISKTYYKCAVYGTSASESTDWKISEIACGLINQEDVSMYKPIVKLVERNPKMPDAQVDGQISFF